MDRRDDQVIPAAPVVEQGSDAPADGAGRSTAQDDAVARSWTWHLMQVSSWLLVVLLTVHVLTTWVFRDPGHFGVAFYVDRWHSGGWRVFDAALVVLALVHGGIGLHGVLTRRITRPSVTTTVTVVIAVVLGTVGALALSTIFTFNAA